MLIALLAWLIEYLLKLLNNSPSSARHTRAVGCAVRTMKLELDEYTDFGAHGAPYVTLLPST